MGIKNIIKLMVVLLVVANTAIAENNLSGPHVTVQTDGTLATGEANIGTQNAGPINFFTNQTKRFSLDGTSGEAVFYRSLSVIRTGTESSLVLGDNGASSYSSFKLKGGLAKYNWNIAAQYNVNNTLEITPSTTAGGSTFSTPAIAVASSGNVGIGVNAPSGKLVVSPPAAQTIAAGGIVAADGCGSIKRITAAGAVTTDTTNTFDVPAAGNTGCVMFVCNSGANNITLDNNANFKSAGGADVVVTPDDCLSVGSSGSVWYQLTALVAN